MTPWGNSWWVKGQLLSQVSLILSLPWLVGVVERDREAGWLIQEVFTTGSGTVTPPPQLLGLSLC